MSWSKQLRTTGSARCELLTMIHIRLQGKTEAMTAISFQSCPITGTQGCMFGGNSMLSVVVTAMRMNDRSRKIRTGLRVLRFMFNLGGVQGRTMVASNNGSNLTPLRLEKHSARQERRTRPRLVESLIASKGLMTGVVDEGQEIIGSSFRSSYVAGFINNRLFQMVLNRRCFAANEHLFTTKLSRVCHYCDKIDSGNDGDAILKPHAMILVVLAAASAAHAQDKGTLERPVLRRSSIPKIQNPQPGNCSAVRPRRPGEAQPVGFYADGCLAGVTALPVTGAAWQVMRLSRNRNWGHPVADPFSRTSRHQGSRVGNLEWAAGRRHVAAARRSDDDRPCKPPGWP